MRYIFHGQFLNLVYAHMLSFDYDADTVVSFRKMFTTLYLKNNVSINDSNFNKKYLVFLRDAHTNAIDNLSYNGY